MLNATKSNTAEGLEQTAQTPVDITSLLQLQADFQNICSYINPDIASVISLENKHFQILARLVPDLHITRLYEDQQDSERLQDQKSHGVPLLLPLTIAIEFEQKIYASAPTTRSLGINVDSLSMMLSMEDAQLIDGVIKKWSRQNENQNRDRTYLFDVVFENDRLGIGLRRHGNKIVVDHVGVDARQLESGDAIHAINGDIIPHFSRTALSEMVERLANETRPLTITFARTLNNQNADIDLQRTGSGSHLAIEGDNLYQGSNDTFDILVTSAVVTVMEKDVTLFRGNASSMEVGCKLSRTSSAVYRVDLSTKIELEYYNLRVWGWEPLLEPGGVSLSAEYQDPHKGPKELSIEIGDRPGGPLCFNLSDAAVETFSKFWKWRQTTEKEFGGVLFAEIGNGDMVDGLVLSNAANAALTFAQRQKKDSAKPCVLRNRTGVSIAFAQQKLNKSGGIVRSGSFLFMTVGDYHGLQGFASSDVTVVSNGEEAKFRVDVLPESQDSKRGRRFPPLTVSMQAVADVQVEPLKDLNITAGDMTFPLAFVNRDGNSAEDISTSREWVSWEVEQVEEKTVLTLGSSIRVFSLLQEAIEIGVEVIEEGQLQSQRTIKSLGTCRSGVPFYLPLWLAMQRCSWRCYTKIASEYNYSLLFTFRKDGLVNTKEIESYIECQSDQYPYKYLAAGVVETNGILTVTLDCAITLRNLLPTRMQWELADNPTANASVIDSSSLRRAGLNSSGSILESGERAEVLSEGFESLHLRLSIPEEPVWSTWVSLSLTRRIIGPTSTTLSQGVDETDVVYCRAKIVDELGISLPVAARIAPKGNVVEVAIYTELWFSNCTELSLVFGCPQEHLAGPLDSYESDSGPTTELSAAEAALKEISSLFEAGDAGKEISHKRVKIKAATSADTVRIPAQTAPTIVEEIFEYIEVEYSTVKRRWWALENPLLTQDNATDIVKDGKTWQWLDKSWVSV